MDEQALGKSVQQWRIHRRLTVRGLAKAIAISHTYVSRLESGDRPLTTELAARLDTELDTEGELGHALTALIAARNDTAPPPPVQLPPAEKLVDRIQLLEQITTALTEHPTEPSHSPRTVVLTGAGGIGKTAVATAAAYQMREHYQGVLWADLRAWDEATGPRTPAVVLRSWCAATGIPTTELPTELDELITLWRTIMADRHYIIGVDNARRDQISPLIPAAPGSVFLITSRDRVHEIPGQVTWIPVPPLNIDDATALVAARSGQPPERIARLAPRGGGLPLALRSLGDYVAAHSADEEMIQQMASDTSTPDAVRRAANLSYQHLTHEQARAWRLCAILPELSPEAAAATTGLSELEVGRLLNAVADVSLLTKVGRGWQYHDLHRQFALELAQLTDPQAERDAAYQRSLLFLLHGWANAGLVLAPNRQSGPSLDPPPEGIHPVEFDTYDSALAWSESRWEYMPLAVDTAIDYGWTRLAWQLVAVTMNYAIIVQPWTVAKKLTLAAAHAAERTHDDEGLAWICNYQGFIHIETGELDHALRYLNRSLELRRQLGDKRDIGWTAQLLGRARLLHGEPIAPTLDLLTESIEALESIGAQTGAASARCLRGNVYLAAGELTRADTDLTLTIEQLPQNPDPLLYCFAQTRHAEVRIAQHRPTDAAQLAQQAADYAHDHAAQASELDALDILGQALRAADDTNGAREAWTQALTIADQTASPHTDRIQNQLDELR